MRLTWLCPFTQAMTFGWAASSARSASNPSRGSAGSNGSGNGFSSVYRLWWLNRTTSCSDAACSWASSQRSCASPMEPSAYPPWFTVSMLMPSTPSAMGNV